MCSACYSTQKTIAKGTIADLKDFRVQLVKWNSPEKLWSSVCIEMTMNSEFTQHSLGSMLEMWPERDLTQWDIKNDELPSEVTWRVAQHPHGWWRARGTCIQNQGNAQRSLEELLHCGVDLAYCQDGNFLYYRHPEAHRESMDAGEKERRPDTQWCLCLRLCPNQIPS